MKKTILTVLLALALPAHAAENGQVLRAGDLKAKPFIDAPKAAALSANQAVTIVSRQGGWAQVTANGITGWMRLLNLRLAASGAAPVTSGSGSRSGNNPSIGSMTNPASMFRTGSSGRTVTTGVKGMDEEDIRNSTPNMAEVQQLKAQGVNANAARSFATRDGLKENTLEYLGKGR